MNAEPETTERDVTKLPPGLPEPVDDGACDHLPGAEFGSVILPAATGSPIDLAGAAGDSRLVIFIYPRTGDPSEPLLPGWDLIPGARGCTPQSCAFRDLHAEIGAEGARVVGLSSQSLDEQRGLAERQQIPFALVSDLDLKLADKLGLPTFETSGLTLYQRVTLIVREGRIEKVFYPVFPPDQNAAKVLRWLRENPVGGMAR